MIGFPLLVGETTSLSRAPRTYAFRAGFALLAAAFAALVWPWKADAASLHAGGHDVFQVFFWVEFLAATFLIPALVAPAIAGERENHTLDLLTVAPVTDMEIVSGKYLAGIALSLSVMAAALPVGIGAVILGGVSPIGLFIVCIHLALHAIVTASLSITISTSVDRSGPAVVLALFVIAAFSVVTAIVGGLLAALVGKFSAVGAHVSFSAISPVGGMFREVYSRTPSEWPERMAGWGMALVYAVGAVMLAATTLRTSRSPRASRGREAFGPPVSPEATARAAAIPMAILATPEIPLAESTTAVYRRTAQPPSPAPVLPPYVPSVPAPQAAVPTFASMIPTAIPAPVVRPAIPAPFLAPRANLPIVGNPVFWKERHFEESFARKAVSVVTALGSLICLVLGGGAWLILEIASSKSGAGAPASPAFAHYFSIAQLAMCLVIAIGAGSATLGQEREQGTLPLLIATGMPPGTILKGKLMAAARSCAWIFSAAALHIGLVGLTMGWRGVAFAAVILVSVVFAGALSTAASLAVGRPRRAGIATLFTLFVLWGLPAIASLPSRGGLRILSDANPFSLCVRLIGGAHGHLDDPNLVALAAFVLLHALAVPALIAWTAIGMEGRVRA